MKKNKCYEFGKAFGIGILILVVAFVVGVYIFTVVEDINKGKFCKNNYPERISSSNNMYGGSYLKIHSPMLYGDDGNDILEFGYVNCCRNYYDDHKLKTECKVLKYE